MMLVMQVPKAIVLNEVGEVNRVWYIFDDVGEVYYGLMMLMMIGKVKSNVTVRFMISVRSNMLGLLILIGLQTRRL